MTTGEQKKCTHADSPECGCACHTGAGVRHIVACCRMCAACGKRIPQSAWHKVDQNRLRDCGFGSDGGEGTANWDPILVSVVRRAMPNLIAYDICNVQPMTGPTGLIFTMGNVPPEEHRRRRVTAIRRKIMHNRAHLYDPPPDRAHEGLPKGLRRELDIRKQVNSIEIMKEVM